MEEELIIKSMACLLVFILSIGFVLMACSDAKTKEFIRKLEQERMKSMVNDRIKFLESFNQINSLEIKTILCDKETIKKLRGES